MLKTGDINRDNFTDIIHIGGTSDPGLFITYALDANNFDLATPCFNVPEAAMAVDFVNLDSLPDIITATADSVFIFLNDGGTDCSMWSVIKLANPSPARSRMAASTIPSISTGYFNKDNKLDFFISPSAIIYGDGAGGADSTITVPNVVLSVINGDFNNDGHEDLLTVEADSIKLLLNDSAGTGTYSASAALFIDTGAVSAPIDNAVADLDRDCNNDFVVITPNVDSTGLSILNIGYGDGLGAFAQVDTFMINGVVRDILISVYVFRQSGQVELKSKS